MKIKEPKRKDWHRFRRIGNNFSIKTNRRLLVIVVKATIDHLIIIMSLLEKIEEKRIEIIKVATMSHKIGHHHIEEKIEIIMIIKTLENRGEDQEVLLHQNQNTLQMILIDHQ